MQLKVFRVVFPLSFIWTLFNPFICHIFYKILSYGVKSINTMKYYGAFMYFSHLVNRNCESSAEMDDVTRRHGNGISLCRHWWICCRGSHCRPLTFRPAPCLTAGSAKHSACCHRVVCVCVWSGPPARALPDRAPSRSSTERATQCWRIQKSPVSELCSRAVGSLLPSLYTITHPALTRLCFMFKNIKLLYLWSLTMLRLPTLEYLKRGGYHVLKFLTAECSIDCILRVVC